METIKFFNRWSGEKAAVSDRGLMNYLNLEPRIAPKTGATYAGNRFHKSYTFIVERLAAKMMVTGHKARKHFISSGHNCGKKFKTLGIVESALAKCEQKTKVNPLALLVKAVENASPREEVISIEYGGARYPKSVDIGPLRRIDLALRNITQGAYLKSFNRKTKIEDALADELLAAYQCSVRSNAIAKKRDLERQAVSSK